MVNRSMKWYVLKALQSLQYTFVDFEVTRIHPSIKTNPRQQDPATKFR